MAGQAVCISSAKEMPVKANKAADAVSARVFIFRCSKGLLGSRQLQNTGRQEIIRNFLFQHSGEAEVRKGLPGNYARLWRFALVLTGDRSSADDLAQATALRAVEYARSFKPGTHLDRWLFVIARRIWLNEKRSEKVRRSGGLVPVEDIDIPDPKENPETNIFAADVFRLVMELPEAQRITVLLVYVEGHSYQEAAEILDIPAGTIMSRLSAARKTIQAAHQPKKVSRQ